MEIGNSLLTNYDKGRKSRAKLSPMDKQFKNIKVRETLSAMLHCTMKITDDEGNETEATALELMVASAIKDAIEHPKGLTQLKEAANILGELDAPTEQKVVFDISQDDLRKKTLGQ